VVVHVIAVGRIRDAALAAACDDYVRRARRGLEIVLCEVREAGRRAPTPVAARAIEGERLRAAIPRGARSVALTRTGRTLSSPELADAVRRWREEARDIALLVGGAHGLAADLLADCELRISLSQLTFPHELARLIVCEQLYRAVTILRGEPYHKGA
jgi:23S rRNA (pseudouridine1915-N3)-methyltransferase